MIRKIVNIDEKKCNGCGLCATACHEEAIQIVNGKAKLISDIYCDGLGDCLPECPTGAIKIIEREAEEYSEEAVQSKKDQSKTVSSSPMTCGCPGTAAKAIKRTIKISKETVKKANHNDLNVQVSSELMQWPVQLRLINPNAEYLENANLLVAADCTAYAYGDFHRDFIKNHTTIIACPKLDDNEYNTEKLTAILKNNSIKSITVVRMEVPCCSGIVGAVKKAMLNSETIVPYKEVMIGTDGSIISQ